MLGSRRNRRGCSWELLVLSLVVVLSTTSRGIAQAAIASNTACECTSSCGTGLLSASKSWCYVNPTSCGVGTCSCLSASKNPYDYCDDSLGLLERERARSQTEIEALKSELNDLRSRLSLDDSTEHAQEAALKEQEIQRKELEAVIASQRSTIAVVSWYSLWCAVAIAAVVSLLAVLFCGYKAFLLRKRTKAGAAASSATEALLSPTARAGEKDVGTPSTEASPGRLGPQTPSDLFPLHKTASPSLGGRDFGSPFLAGKGKVSAVTGTPGSAHEVWSDEDVSRRQGSSRSKPREGAETPRLASDTKRGSYIQRMKLHKPEIEVDEERHHGSTSEEGPDKSNRVYYSPSLADKQ